MAAPRRSEAAAPRDHRVVAAAVAAVDIAAAPVVAAVAVVAAVVAAAAAVTVGRVVRGAAAEPSFFDSRVTPGARTANSGVR